MRILDRVQLASFGGVCPDNPPGLALWARRTAASNRSDVEIDRWEGVGHDDREAAGAGDTPARSTAQSQRL